MFSPPLTITSSLRGAFFRWSRALLGAWLIVGPFVGIYARDTEALGQGAWLITGAALAGLKPALVEADISDTYDPARDAVASWTGIRLRDLSEVLGWVEQRVL